MNESFSYIRHRLRQDPGKGLQRGGPGHPGQPLLVADGKYQTPAPLFRRRRGHPYIITFVYSVGSISYEGKRYIPIRYRVPQVGETINIYYDPERPGNYACYAFGPAINQ